MEQKDIFNLRKSYSKHRLDEQDLEKDPVDQFQKWLHEALEAGLDEPYAFTLSTLDESGHPDSRVVLLRKVEKQGFSFFTNYESTKGRQIENHPWVAMNFFWAALERQVRIMGAIKPLSSLESDTYFASRPRESQLGAWVSLQSQELENRSVLEAKMQKLTSDYDGKTIPRPPHWGGYLIVPSQFEFWQGRPSRLHDRFHYYKNNHSEYWSIRRLNP